MACTRSRVREVSPKFVKPASSTSTAGVRAKISSPAGIRRVATSPMPLPGNSSSWYEGLALRQGFLVVNAGRDEISSRRVGVVIKDTPNPSLNDVLVKLQNVADPIS